MSLNEDWGTFIRTHPFWRAAYLVLLTLLAGFLVWSVYLRVTTGVDPRDKILTFLYVENARISVPISVCLLVIGVIFSLRRGGAELRVKPSLIVAALVAFAILVWFMVNDI
jgi:hypothetical protein